MKWSRLATMILGVFVIALLAPLTQFLTMSTVNADIETATPVGWAVGIVFSLVVVLSILRWLSKRRMVSKGNLIILYTMLTLSVPVMNLGLVRQFFLSVMAAQAEYLVVYGTDTYRTAYDVQDPDWFPIVPTQEGLAWNKTDRLLSLLDDAEQRRRQKEARARLSEAILAYSQTHQVVSQPTPSSPDADHLEWIARLGVDELIALDRWIEKQGQQPVVTAMGLTPHIEARREAAMVASARQAETLPEELASVDEFTVMLVPEKMETWPTAILRKIERQRSRLSDPERRRQNQRVAQLAARFDELQRRVTLLSSTDRAKVHSRLTAQLLARYEQMSESEVDAIRSSFVYRLTQDDRKQLSEQDGWRRQGTVNQNLAAFQQSLWNDLKASQTKQRRKGLSGFETNLSEVLQHLPWHLWVLPMVMWGLLFTVIYLLIMCSAEWLRRKWIHRENLAFPLVEIADSIIRHDYAIERAEDIHDPPARTSSFNGFFLVGMGLGAVLLFMEAMSHYGMVSGTYTIHFDVTKELFTTGALKEMDNVLLVISPIVVGIAFLVSLEVSFSVWALYFIYKIIVLAGKLADPNIRDSLYTGWAGGKNYPFPMAQMLGASVCFAAIILYKSWQSQRQQDKSLEDIADEDYFIPPRLNRIGLVVLPILLGVLLWSQGVLGAVDLVVLLVLGGAVVLIAKLPGLSGRLRAGAMAVMLVLVGVVLLVSGLWDRIGGAWLVLLAGAGIVAQTLAMARARAETGLHTHHVSYEYTKLPIVFGLTGITGAKVYTRFITLAFLPITLLFRTLPQHLENMELARRNNLKLRTLAPASVLAFVVALAVGMTTLLVGSYYYGGTFNGGQIFKGYQGNTNSFHMARYPLWVSHFQGAEGLDKFTQPHWIRIAFMGIGFSAFGALTLLRNRFLRFPLHPLGYYLVLVSIYYTWVSPYYKGDGTGVSHGASWLWGSVFAAWLLKKLIIKYGGMNSYRRSKPLFIGLVVGSIVCVFGWNVVDLVCSIIARYQEDPGSFIRFFIDRPPFSPDFY